MKKLLPLLLLWLSACATLPYAYSPQAPTSFYAMENSIAYRTPAGEPVGDIVAGRRFTVVGSYNEYKVIKTNWTLYLVPAAALSENRVYAASFFDSYIYNNGGRSSRSSYGTPSYSPVPDGVTHDTYTGPRGGHYYYNGNGNKSYVTPQSTINNNYIQTGPRGGQYYRNSNGNKTYIKH